MSSDSSTSSLAASIPPPSLWRSRWARLCDLLQRVRHHRAIPYLYVRTALTAPGRGAAARIARYRRMLELRPDNPVVLSWLSDDLARSGDWSLFAEFLDIHEHALRSRLSNVAMARLAEHMRLRGWLGRAETWLSPRVKRFPHSPALVQAYALLGREARRRGDAETWAWVAAWHLDRARFRTTIRAALQAAGAPHTPAMPIETEIIAQGQGHLCAFRHRLGEVSVVEKAVERWSPEAQVLGALTAWRLQPPGKALQISPPLFVAADPAHISLFFADWQVPALSAAAFAAQIEEITVAMARFNAANAGHNAAQLPALETRLDLEAHGRGMAPTLALFASDEAARLRQAWQAVLDCRAALLREWRALPHVPQHEDVHADNLLATEPPTLIDWDHAVYGPAGAELRVMLLMSGERQFDDAAASRLVGLYAATFREEGVALSDRQAALGLWWPYFVRHAVAPSPHHYDLRLARHAIEQGYRLLAGRG